MSHKKKSLIIILFHILVQSLIWSSLILNLYYIIYIVKPFVAEMNQSNYMFLKYALVTISL